MLLPTHSFIIENTADTLNGEGKPLKGIAKVAGS